MIAIAEEVGHLPIALEMLAIQLNVPGHSPGTVLAALHQVPNSIQLDRFQELEGLTVPRPQGVFAAITGTLALLSEEDRQRLSSLAYVADAPVPCHCFAP